MFLETNNLQISEFLAASQLGLFNDQQDAGLAWRVKGPIFDLSLDNL